MDYLLGLIVSFLFVFMRGLQTQNVVHKKIGASVVVSCILAAIEIANIGLIVKLGWDMWPSLAVGSSLGMVASMFFHRRFIHRIGSSKVGDRERD